MKRADAIGGIIFFFFALIISSQAWHLNYLSNGEPGPGFVPLWTGIVMGIAALAQIAAALLRTDEGHPPKQRMQPQRVKTLFGVAAMNLAAVVVIDYAGFSLTVAVFLFVLIHWIGRHNRITSAAVSVGLTAAFFVVFDYLLKIPLPKGWIGF